MSVIIPNPEPETVKVPIKDLISLLALILGSIILSIGSFIALGIAIGLMIVGALFIVIAILFGLNR